MPFLWAPIYCPLFIDRKLTKNFSQDCYTMRAVELTVILEIFMNNTDHPPSLNGEE